MDFTADQRHHFWTYLITRLEQYYARTETIPVAPRLDKKEIADYVRRFEDTETVPPEEAIQHVLDGLTRYTVHTPHPHYYGLFNPRPGFAGILADTITATFNPQLAAWSHAPFAAEAESFLIQAVGRKFGYTEPDLDGTFTSGGAEANLTAVLCALNYHFPSYAADGLQSLSARPVLYCSRESHHSVQKAASVAGLGMQAVRVIETDDKLRMDLSLLHTQLETDRSNGFRPFLCIATAGTTGVGAIDPIEAMSHLARTYDCWLHVDGAYGGALALSPAYASLLQGISHADSVTFDAHKWLSVPMSTSLFITRHADILHRTFRILADYMPKEASNLAITDPFAHSIQWSRRHIGLKLYLSLLMYGWKGFAQVIDQQIGLAQQLRQRLQESNWILYNDTLLPIVCTGQKDFETQPQRAVEVCQKVIATGKAWISVYKTGSVNALRICIINYQTSEKDIDELVDVLNQVVS